MQSREAAAAATQSSTESSASTPDPIVTQIFQLSPANIEDAYGPRPPGVPKLSRSEIVRLGLENPLIKAADEKIEIMRSTLREVKFAWIPVIETSAILSPGANIKCTDVELQTSDGNQQPFQYCRSGKNDDIDIQTIEGYFKQLNEAGVAFSIRAQTVIPLFTFGKIRNAKKLAQVGMAITQLEREAVRQETVLKVYEAHTALLLARMSIGILQRAWQIVQGERTKIASDLGQNQAAESWELDPEEVNAERDPDDLLQLEIGEIELAERMREARKIEAQALSVLWAITGNAAPRGYDITETELVLDQALDPKRSLEDYRGLALENRPEAALMAAAVKARKLQEKFARSQFFPDFGAVARFSLGRANRSEQPSTLYYSGRLNYDNIFVGLAMSWNLDFHRDYFELQRARATSRQTAFQREAALRKLGLEVDGAFRELRASRDTVDLMALARDKSWRLLLSQQQKQSVGGGDFKELRKVLKSWAEFEFRRFQAIQSHNVAWAKLSRAVGTPLTEPTPVHSPAQL